MSTRRFEFLGTLRTVKTECVCPPHWTAIDDNTYAGPGSAIGTGTTEKEAIDDLLEHIKDEEDPSALGGTDLGHGYKLG